MVLHFTNLPSHRRSILSLYRTLLRHARHLDQVTKFPDSNKLSVGSFVSNGIRSIFQKHKHWMSIINTESEIKKIYKCEAILREAYAPNADNTDLVPRLQNLLPKPRKEETPLMWNEPLKGDTLLLDNEAIALFSKLNFFTYKEKKHDRLPKKKKLDSKYLEVVLLSDLLYKESRKRLKEIRGEINKGPYIVSLTNAIVASNMLMFPRVPWRQSKKLSGKIAQLIVQNQNTRDIMAVYESGKWKQLAINEAIWEYNIQNAIKSNNKLENDNDSGKSLEKLIYEWTIDIQEAYHSIQKEMDDLNQEVLEYGPIIKRQQNYYQTITFLMYGRRKARFEKVQECLSKLNPTSHSDYAGIDLHQILNDYDFIEKSGK